MPIAVVAIAEPTLWTSWTSMCRNTEAAVCSPSVSSKIAARSVPLTVLASAIVFCDPIANDLCDLPRIVARDVARGRHAIVVAHRQRERPAARRGARVCAAAELHSGRDRQRGLRTRENLHHRPED